MADSFRNELTIVSSPAPPPSCLGFPVFFPDRASISVGATEDSAGASVLTDPQIEQTWAQVKPVGADWSSATTVENTSADLFEMNVISNT